MGAKNHATILPDAQKDFALDQVVGECRRHVHVSALRLVRVGHRCVRAGASFGAAGQRCMALPFVILVGQAKEWYVLRRPAHCAPTPRSPAARRIPDIVARAKTLKVGPGADPSSALGPLISKQVGAQGAHVPAGCAVTRRLQSKARVLELVASGVKEGAKLELDGTNIKARPLRVAGLCDCPRQHARRERRSPASLTATSSAPPSCLA